MLELLLFASFCIHALVFATICEIYKEINHLRDITNILRKEINQLIFFNRWRKHLLNRDYHD